MQPRSTSLLASLLILSACTSNGSTTPPADTALIGPLPGDCVAAAAPDAAEVTFLSDGRLFAALPDGSGVRCLIDLAEGGADTTWGGEADRVALNTPSGGLVLVDGEEVTLSADETSPTFQGLSRPVGTSLVYISGDGSRLFKVPVDGGRIEDISFLERHDEVVYHPSGTSVIAVGENDAGIYGVFMATNEGADSRVLAIAEDAKRVFSLAFSHDGRTLFYAAEHEDRYDLHSLALSLRKGAEAAPETRLRTLHQSQQPIDNVVVSDFSKRPPVAFTEGDCESGLRTSVWHAGEVQQVDVGEAGDITTPDGWLPDGSLAVTTTVGACGGPGSVSLWSDGSLHRFVDGAGEVAIRARLPAPPKPLELAPGVVP